MSNEYELASGNPRDSRGFEVVYPDRIKALEESRASRNPEPVDKVLSREQAAKYLGVSLSTVDRLIAKEEIPYYKVGSRTLFLRSELDIFIADRKKVPEGWEDEQFRQRLIRKQESQRLYAISKRAGELAAILGEITKAEKEGRGDEVRHLSQTVDAEIRALLNEEEAIKQEQIKRLRDKSGLQMDNEDAR